MSSDQAETYSPEAAPEKKGGGCLKGCLIALVILIILAAIAGWWISQNIKGIAASFGTQAVQQALSESGLPAEEQAEIMVEVQRAADAFSNGDLTFEESAELMQELAESPLMSLFIVTVIERGYFDSSGLSDEEKAEASVAIKRFSRGYVDGSIDQSAFDELMAYVADPNGQGGWEMRDREQVTDEDLRALIADAKAKADEAEIPEEVEPIDPSDEFKKIVDAALGE